MKKLYSVDELLNILYSELVKNSKDIGVYALKGGFVLSRYITNSKMRATSDIDMSVTGDLSFNKIVEVLKPILEKLKLEGQISKYEVKAPRVSETKNTSGKIKLFRKYSKAGIPIANQPSMSVCGIDISIHDLSFGLMTLNDGMTSFSIERMLSDKVAVLYSDERKIIRRCRDLYDIFLFDMLNLRVDIDVFKECLAYRKINIWNKSCFEDIVLNGDYKSLKDVLWDLIQNGKRMDKEFAMVNKVTPDLIISKVLCVLDLLRGSL